MIGASLYIIVCSAWNRARMRLRRLREPRYLIGAIVGTAYFYLSLVRYRPRQEEFARRRGRGLEPAVIALLMNAGSAAVAVLLAGITAFTWLSLAPSGGLLDLSRSEVQFLLPAPVTKRGVLLHRLLRSQLGLLLAATLPMLFVPRGSAVTRIRVGIAAWVTLTTLRLVSTGVALWRGYFIGHGRRKQVIAGLSLVVTVTPFAVGAAALGLEFWRSPNMRSFEMLTRVSDITRTGVVGALLSPFLALAAPMFAADWAAFAPRLAGAFCVLALAALWVFASNDALDVLSGSAAAKPERTSPSGKRYQLRASVFDLPAAAWPELIFFWKSATEASRAVNLKTLSAASITGLVVIAGASASGLLPRGAAETLMVMALLAIAFATLLGPQALRLDLRADMEHLSLLKTWPIAPAAVVRGQILWPAALLTAIVWSLVAAVAFIAPTAVPELRMPWRLTLVAAALLLAPGLIAAQYAIHNAAALIFPGWVTFGKQRPRGFDAMGQRLILMAGTWVALVVMMLPGALAAGLLWLVLGPTLGPVVLVAAALVCLAALLTETVLATVALGPVYARLDVTDVERAE